jgi:hypothetical protein
MPVQARCNGKSTAIASSLHSCTMDGSPAHFVVHHVSDVVALITHRTSRWTRTGVAGRKLGCVMLVRVRRNGKSASSLKQEHCRAFWHSPSLVGANASLLARVISRRCRRFLGRCCTYGRKLCCFMLTQAGCNGKSTAIASSLHSCTMDGSPSHILSYIMMLPTLIALITHRTSRWTRTGVAGRKLGCTRLARARRNGKSTSSVKQEHCRPFWHPLTNIDAGVSGRVRVIFEGWRRFLDRHWVYDRYISCIMMEHDSRGEKVKSIVSSSQWLSFREHRGRCRHEMQMCELWQRPSVVQRVRTRSYCDSSTYSCGAGLAMAGLLGL